MKISTKGRYAVRLLLDIAMNDEVEPVRLKRCCGTSGYFHEILGTDYFYTGTGRVC